MDAVTFADLFDLGHVGRPRGKAGQFFKHFLTSRRRYQDDRAHGSIADDFKRMTSRVRSQCSPLKLTFCRLYDSRFGGYHVWLWLQRN